MDHKFTACRAVLIKLNVVVCTGGWNQEPKRIPKAEVVPNEWATPEHFGEGRVRLCTSPDWRGNPCTRITPIGDS